MLQTNVAVICDACGKALTLFIDLDIEGKFEVYDHAQAEGWECYAFEGEYCPDCIVPDDGTSDGEE